MTESRHLYNRQTTTLQCIIHQLNQSELLLYLKYYMLDIVANRVGTELKYKEPVTLQQSSGR